MSKVIIEFDPAVETDVLQASRAINGTLETFGHYIVTVSKSELAQAAPVAEHQPAIETPVQDAPVDAAPVEPVAPEAVTPTENSAEQQPQA